ncbi:hypothetical protein N9A08_03695 [Arthrobacter koreensis]|uniref:Uncharacterized protein n=1 Tax=Arthrobacter koreensis TaxID=199136 RepID=A0ABY6FV21_9MICC|nr:NgoMIV family type II restriction endonuclease [Arthrobacter koreensis]UYB36789.1 hypothetical protein N9A08_03695 [Arthrobacter koreensis]
MSAPFASLLCGYRTSPNGVLTTKPNTSDANDSGSVELGHALFEELGVPADQASVADPGAELEKQIESHLQPLRADLVIQRSRSVLEFQQYAHLRVFPEFKKHHISASSTLENLLEIANRLPSSPEATQIKKTLKSSYEKFLEQDAISERLKLYMPEESLLNLDLTFALAAEGTEQQLRLGLSSKWTLRTDRAQDCLSQGSKLASQRRGPMPHYGVITMEPRPAMLKILADGSGAVDYVYHLALPELVSAVEKLRSTKRKGWSPGITFERLLNQGRLRDYADLVREVQAIPTFQPSPIAAGAFADAEATAGRAEDSDGDSVVP